MNWLEVTVNTCHDQLETLTGRLTALGVDGFITEDEADVREFLENNKKYWDYVDEAFMRSMSGVCRVKFYFANTQEGRSGLARVLAGLPEWEAVSRPVRDEDWENNWRAYYQPIPVGERLLIVPQWLEAPESDRVPLRLDPGLIFGTGAHATTQLCLAETEKYAPGRNVLDLGCGSGILAIAALLLGAGRAVGVDIDDKAPGVVMENAGFNGIGPDRLTVFAGDVLSDRALSRRLSGERFGLVLMNIVADVIISLAPKVPEFLPPGGIFICSGVIEGRQAEVEAALRGAGLAVIRRAAKDGWHAFVCEKEEDHHA